MKENGLYIKKVNSDVCRIRRASCLKLPLKCFRREGKRERKKDKTNVINVNICVVWVKGTWELTVLFLQLFYKSGIMSK